MRTVKGCEMRIENFYFLILIFFRTIRVINCLILWIANQQIPCFTSTIEFDICLSHSYIPYSIAFKHSIFNPFFTPPKSFYNRSPAQNRSNQLASRFYHTLYIYITVSNYTSTLFKQTRQSIFPPVIYTPPAKTTARGPCPYYTEPQPENSIQPR